MERAGGAGAAPLEIRAESDENAKLAEISREKRENPGDADIPAAQAISTTRVGNVATRWSRQKRPQPPPHCSPHCVNDTAGWGGLHRKKWPGPAVLASVQLAGPDLQNLVGWTKVRTLY